MSARLYIGFAVLDMPDHMLTVIEVIQSFGSTGASVTYRNASIVGHNFKRYTSGKHDRGTTCLGEKERAMMQRSKTELPLAISTTIGSGDKFDSGYCTQIITQSSFRQTTHLYCMRCMQMKHTRSAYVSRCCSANTSPGVPQKQRGVLLYYYQ